jgi:hypothetical protein
MRRRKQPENAGERDDRELPEEEPHPGRVGDEELSSVEGEAAAGGMHTTPVGHLGTERFAELVEEAHEMEGHDLPGDEARRDITDAGKDLRDRRDIRARPLMTPEEERREGV